MVGGTALLCAWWRAVGVRVGAGVYLDAAPPVELDQLEIGDGAVVAEGMHIYPQPVEKDTQKEKDGTRKAVRLRRIRIGRGAVCAGPSSSVQSGAIVGDGCVLTPLTLVQKQGVLPAAMIWAGNPAEKLVNLPPRLWEAAARGQAGSKKTD